jgi:hypothetical protein
MRTPQDLDHLRHQAVLLRRQGKSLRQIKAILGPMSNATLHDAQFCTPTLKRHNPKTVRKNVGEDYHGCLRIDARRGADLYRKIEGWATSSMGASRVADPKPTDER